MVGALDTKRRPATWAGLSVCLTAVGFAVAWALAAGVIHGSLPAGYDSHAYWAVDASRPYVAGTYNTVDGFYYSPAFAQTVSLIHWLPWEAFRTVWAVLLAASLTWLLGPFTIVALLVPDVDIELISGNVNIPIAAAVVLGLRYPAAWAFVLLTKVTPGVGILWFALRREWRSFAIAVGGTALITAVSFLIGPLLWFDWLRTLAGNAGGAVPATAAVTTPLMVRLVLALVLVVYAARTDRPALLVLVAMLGMPVLWGVTLWVILAVGVLATTEGSPAGCDSGP